MPYKNQDTQKEYHRQYMGEYNKTHPKTDEQKKKKCQYQKMWADKNKDKVRENSHKSYLRNKEKRAQRAKEYREKNKEEVARHKHEYYLKNKEKFSLKAKAYRDNNSEQIKARLKVYCQTPHAKFLAYINSANTRGYDFNLTENEFTEIFLSPCHYCGTEECRGVDRKDNRIGYNIGNTVPCCRTCNFMKKAMDYKFFIEHVTRIAQNHN